jgi:hypothetical protein
MGARRIAEKSSLDNVLRERASTAATNDNDEVDALAEELIEDAWLTPVSKSMVVRKAKKPRCNPVRIKPFQRHIELPSARVGHWYQLVTPDREGPLVDHVTGLDVRTVDDLTPSQVLKVEEAYARACLDWANRLPPTYGTFNSTQRDEDVRSMLRHLFENCDLPLDLKELVPPSGSRDSGLREGTKVV